ncbi:MAG: hypothetical protein HY744_19820 [Deltaproteobacteria bacterium]|nr:hypothetical protein [Deltaproteobacteria bacterium]
MRSTFWGLTALALAAGLVGGLCTGCARAIDFVTGAGGAGGGAGQGGAPVGEGGSGGEAQGGGPSGPCSVDCSKIETDACHHGVCNEETGKCAVVAAADGAPCEDGLFCTAGDTCAQGVCQAGGPNDCAQSPPPCHAMVCNEGAKSCEPKPAQEGSSCKPDELCRVNGKCMNGLCIGTPKDCLFAPVPDQCHVALCDPKSGDCVPEPGNDGKDCTDQKDLCTVGKKCSGGKCEGGAPKDCSLLTKGCKNGVCDAKTGNCVEQPVAPGGKCDEASNQCNQGICDNLGGCLPTPVKEGQGCSDGDTCTSGETCQGGKCQGGAPVVQCIANDGCCPQGCTENDDADCSCNVDLALGATPSHSGGGDDQNGYGPKKFNDGVGQKSCQQNGCDKCFGWISNGQGPNGEWAQLAWSQPVTIGSVYVETDHATQPICGTPGRNIASAKLQWWNGNVWVSAHSFQNEVDDLQVSLTPKLTTSKIRLYDMTTSPGNGNSMIFEWYVYAGAGCKP